MKYLIRLIILLAIFLSSKEIFAGNYTIYNPKNGHYYEFFERKNTSWEEAKNHTTRHQDNPLKILKKGAMNMRNIKGGYHNYEYQNQ